MPSGRETFERLAKGGPAPGPTPVKQFPRIPQRIKDKFPDLKIAWEEYEKEIETWVKALQTV